MRPRLWRLLHFCLTPTQAFGHRGPTTEPTRSNSVSRPTRCQRHQLGSNLRRSRRFDKLRPNLPPIRCAQNRIPYDRPGRTRLQGASNPRSSRRLLRRSASPGRDAPDRVSWSHHSASASCISAIAQFAKGSDQLPSFESECNEHLPVRETFQSRRTEPFQLSIVMLVAVIAAFFRSKVGRRTRNQRFRRHRATDQPHRAAGIGFALAASISAFALAAANVIERQQHSQPHQ